MSNKIVPSIYRAVIDDVISAIKPEFDEFGVAEDVLAELQNKWENKVIASHVAEFETPAPPQAPHMPHQPQHHVYPPHPMHMMQTHAYNSAHNPYASLQPTQVQQQQQQQQQQPGVKSEPVDNRYALNAPIQYSIPSLPGPQLGGARQLPPIGPNNPGGQIGVLSFNGRVPTIPPTRQYPPQPPQPPQQQQQQQPPRIPQVDGPSESSGDEDSPSPPPSQAFAPRTSHPSLPQPNASTSSSRNDDSEAINSDLDDSDTEGEEEAEEGAAGETDIVFCTYDKVARVKNKWKCVLKDGMIHVNGKDYLFAKCTGEFEW